MKIDIYDEDITIYSDETVRAWGLKENMYWWKERDREKIPKTPRDVINIILFTESDLRFATYEISRNATIKFKYQRHVRHFEEAFKKIGCGYELKYVGPRKIQISYH